MIPTEPPPGGPLYAHVAWPSPTLSWVTVGFRAPAFSDTEKDYAALDMLANVYFGNTSDLYKKLVVAEQKVDEFGAGNPGNVDPGILTVLARVRQAADAVYVRDEILKTIALAKTTPLPARRLEEAKANSRYGLTRGLDSTERIAGLLAEFVHYARSYSTINNLYRAYDSLTPADLQQAAEKYFTDAGLVVTTLSSEPLPAGISAAPALASLAPLAHAASSLPPIVNPRSLPAVPGAKPTSAPLVLQKTLTPQLDIKLFFRAGSAIDPPGKEGLAALAAAMITDAGSKTLTVDQINAVLYPMAGSFVNQVDKEVTTFTGTVHRDNWRKFLSTVLPQLLEPGLREEDFQRVKQRQLNALVEDLRSSNEEELGKERLQTNIFRDTPYGHPALGTVAGLTAISLDDVRQFVQRAYGQARLTLGVSGNVPDECLDLLKLQLGRLPAGTPEEASRPAAVGRRPSGLEVEIVEKDTRSTAISFGLPIAVTRAHPDFAALSVARVWLGEHRASSGRLYQRIREVRGMNYGDYAYIEAFPRGMFQFFPDPNVVRRAQLFEVWIRPVVPENAHMALRVAIHELDRLLTQGLTENDFEQSRNYLMRNVFLMTARQDEQLGYALDSLWYRTGEFTEMMRKALAALTVDQVNAAIRKHWSATDLSVVIITKDAAGLRRRLLSDAFSPIKYDGEKPASLLEEDKVIGARKLGLTADKVKVTPVADVFAK